MSAVLPLKRTPRRDAAPLLLDVEDVMELCGIGRHTALSWMHAAGCIRWGRILKIRRVTLEAFLARLEGQEAQPENS
jgi:hypothetical protein